MNKENLNSHFQMFWSSHLQIITIALTELKAEIDGNCLRTAAVDGPGPPPCASVSQLHEGDGRTSGGSQ